MKTNINNYENQIYIYTHFSLSLAVRYNFTSWKNTDIYNEYIYIYLLFSILNSCKNIQYIITKTQFHKNYTMFNASQKELVRTMKS